MYPTNNPLFPGNQPNQTDPASYVLPRKENTVLPLTAAAPGRNAALDVIRQKLDRIYNNEPEAAAEVANVAAVPAVSPHQQFMQQLIASGRRQDEIEDAWHQYYVALPDTEKHAVWREFYASGAALQRYPMPDTPVIQPAEQLAAAMPTAAAQPQAAISQQPITATAQALPSPTPLTDTSSTAHPAAPAPEAQLAFYPYPSAPARPLQPSDSQAPAAVVSNHTPVPLPAGQAGDARSRRAIKQGILNRVSANGQLKAKHHFQSLLFGLGMGTVAVVIFLFGFFNEVLIAPFIQPSRQASATPLILSTDGVAPTNTPEVIIPKINVEIPVDYSQTSTDEYTIENALESGVVHYPTTAMPGQNGNAAFFGHSSNNIFNKGKYKFAFVLLHTLVPGDTFYLTYNSKVYVYKVISKDIVDPADIGVLGPVAGQQATATLITCDPPGTSLHRLIIVGQQISPSPANNSGAQNPPAQTPITGSATLPGNGPTLWHRLWSAIF